MISGHVSTVLWGWAIASPFLFRLLPGRDAATVCLVVGWAFLPVAAYPAVEAKEIGQESAVHALAIPTPDPVNKATAIGLGCLLGLTLFDRRTFASLRWDRSDLPIVAWCLVPIASTAANGLPLSDGLAQVRSLALAWGSPYLMGRAYLTDEASRARFAVGLVAGGLAYVPICLLELVEGPTLYRIVYGPHPYEFEGSARFLLNRPLGFLEHGNQLGMWMATSALAATWLWASGAVKRPGGLAGGGVAASLVGTTWLCQSHGSIALLTLGLLPILGTLAPRGRGPWRRVAFVVVGLISLAAGAWLVRRGLGAGSIRLAVGDLFKGAGKSSFTWRLARVEELMPIAGRRPWLGWGRADWKGDGLGFGNPVNLPAWLLVAGMSGVIGLAAWGLTWASPILRTGRTSETRSWLGPVAGASGALAGVVVINFFDSLSNAVVILPILCAVGGLGRGSSINDPPGRSRASRGTS